MKYFFYISILFLIVSCDNDSVNNTNTVEYKKDTIIDTKTTTDTLVDENTQPKIDVLPFFDLKFNADGFETFYNNLVESCINKDTAAVLDAIYDSLRFSKYECAYGYFTDNKNCDGCLRCTKKGILEGIFAGANNEKVCSRLLEMITKYGVGPYEDNYYYNKFMLIENAYTNFHFVNDSLYDNYFDYGMIIPLKNNIEIKTEPSELSNTLNYLPFQPIDYPNEPGMGVRSEDGSFYWLEYSEGYIKSNEVLTGFDYTLVIFEKTPSGWKITGFIKPPGC